MVPGQRREALAPLAWSPTPDSRAGAGQVCSFMKRGPPRAALPAGSHQARAEAGDKAERGAAPPPPPPGPARPPRPLGDRLPAWLSVPIWVDLTQKQEELGQDPPPSSDCQRPIVSAETPSGGFTDAPVSWPGQPPPNPDSQRREGAGEALPSGRAQATARAAPDSRIDLDLPPVFQGKPRGFPRLRGAAGAEVETTP